ncbi:MAG: DUF4476 domain-containing protein [Flavobacteriales bacterium]|jgi:hypothetical protein
MKKFFTLCISMATFGFAAQAQLANAVVFSENGEKFTLYLNGEAQNTTPQANVKVKDLTGEFYQARVDFADATLADITNNNFAVHKGFEATYKIKANNKGVYVLRWQSESPLSGTTVSSPSSETVVEDYAIVEEEVEMVEEKAPAKSTPNGVNISMNTNVDGTNANQDVVIEETTTTTTTTAKPAKTTTTPTTGEKVNVNMNVGGVNMGINMNVEGMDMEVEESSSTTVTTTTTTTKSTPAQPAKPAPAPRQEVVVVEKTTGCGKAMDAASFNTAKSSISSKGFDETRLTVAKQVAKSNCLSTSQIKEIMNIFGFEETKLDFAKYAYDYCTDQGNYYLINDAFSFESTIDELNQYIESK